MEVEKGLIWAVVLQEGDKLRPSSIEAMNEALLLSKKLGIHIAAAFFGEKDFKAPFPADSLVIVRFAGSDVTDWQPEQISRALSQLFSHAQPTAVFFGHGEQEREALARLAASSDNFAPALDYSNILSNKADPDSSAGFTFTRPAFQRKVSATITVCEDKSPLFLLPKRSGKPDIQPGSGAADSPNEVVVELSSDETHLPKLIERIKDDIATLDLVDAQIIVAGGAGVVDKEGFRLVEELAEKLGGKAATSRKAADMGLADPEKLVGMSGKTVSPDLYIACGISGASQHICGMEDSGTIITINTDKYAPISKLADVQVVGDVKQVIPMLLKELG